MRIAIPAVSSVTMRAILYMVLSALCFAVVELTGQVLVQGISPYQLVWGRYAVHLLFMVVVLGPRYKSKLVQTGALKLQILRSMTMLAMPVCFILAASAMPANDVWSVYWSSPLVMLALSTWILGEPAGGKRWIAGLVGFAGMLFVFQPDKGVFSPASVLAFGMGVAISLHLMLSRILRHDHPLTSLFHTALWVFVVLSFVVPFLWQTPSLRTLLGIIIVGLVGMVGLFVLARSGELVPLPVVASFSYTEAIWRLALNALFLGIMPHKSELLGVLIVAGVIGYLLFNETRQPRVEAAIEHAAATN